MSHDQPFVQKELIETVFNQFRAFRNSLKPVDEENGWFFQIVSELMDATLSNYSRLKQGYNEKSPLLAWACRNLLELAIFSKYVLISEANARRFALDRLIDGCDIITSLRALELYLDPKSDTKLLDDALARMQAQMVAEGATAKKHLKTSLLADVVGMKEDYACMNRVCSKLVHPTGWSILAVNKVDDSFSQSREIFFGCGAQYGCDVYMAVKERNATYGMKPKP